jgi:hypothetical protein
MYNVGDTIIMNSSADAEYIYSRGGAIGTIVLISGMKCQVKFIGKTLCQYTGKNNPIFSVLIKHFSLNDNKRSIERKIDRMWKRQKYYAQHSMV